MAPRGRPPKKIEEWAFAPPPLGEPNIAGERKSKLVDVLVNAGNGKLALALARQRESFHWDGPAERWTPDQRKAQHDALREVVEIWVDTHARNLDWSLAILGSRASNRRDEMKATATAHRNAVKHIRIWASDPFDADATHRAAAAVDALPGDQSVPGVTPISPDAEKVTGETIQKAAASAREQTPDNLNGIQGQALVKMIISYASECDRVSKGIKGWLEENPAQGGANLGSREVAELVASFFDDGREAAQQVGIPERDLPKVAYADDHKHDPRNPYSAAVKSALEIFGHPADSWRYAVESICRKRKKHTADKQ